MTRAEAIANHRNRLMEIRAEAEQRRVTREAERVGLLDTDERDIPPALDRQGDRETKDPGPLESDRRIDAGPCPRVVLPPGRQG